MHAGLREQLRRPQHRLRGERHRRRAVEPHLHAAVGERLDHERDVGGARARETPPRLHLLPVENDRATDRGEDLLRPLHVVQLRDAVRAHVGDEDLVGGNEVRLHEATDERLAHVARADEADLFALDAHLSPCGARTWPPTPPDARTRPGGAVARLGVDTGYLIALTPPAGRGRAAGAGRRSRCPPAPWWRPPRRRSRSRRPSPSTAPAARGAPPACAASGTSRARPRRARRRAGAPSVRAAAARRAPSAPPPPSRPPPAASRPSTAPGRR